MYSQKRMVIMIHELKCWPDFYEAVLNGNKTFEVRKDDRGFKVGDILHLREWNPKTETYSGRELARTVTYILRGGQLGIEEGYVVMGLGVAPETTLRYAGILKN
jgi:ribosomal protein S17